MPRKPKVDYRVSWHLGVELACQHTAWLDQGDDKLWYESVPHDTRPKLKPTKLAPEPLARYAERKLSVKIANAAAQATGMPDRFELKERVDLTCPVCGGTLALR